LPFTVIVPIELPGDSAPFTVIVPIELPGDSAPLIVVEGRMPTPPTSAPASTVRPLDVAIEPFHHQCARIDRGWSSVGVDSGERQRARSFLDDRAACTTACAPVVDDAAHLGR
jgi:hypothetical protein